MRGENFFVYYRQVNQGRACALFLRSAHSRGWLKLWGRAVRLCHEYEEGLRTILICDEIARSSFVLKSG